MSSLDRVSKESIPNLAPGQVILTGILFELPIIIQVDPCKTNYLSFEALIGYYLWVPNPLI